MVYKIKKQRILYFYIILYIKVINRKSIQIGKLNNKLGKFFRI